MRALPPLARHGRPFPLPAYALLTLVVATPAWAGPPAAFNNWSLDKNKKIVAPCPVNFACEVNVHDQGMLQRMITDKSGKRYFQQIIADGNIIRNTNAASESFVAGSGTTHNGIAAKQHVVSTGATQMSSDVNILTGWAKNGNENAITISQSLYDATNKSPVIYSSTFDAALHYAANGKVTGNYIAILQDVSNSTALNGAQRASGRDIHRFVNRTASGDFVAKGSASLPPFSTMMGGGMGGMGGSPTGGTISWNAGDTVKVDYVGQICEGCGGGMMGGGMGGGGGGGGGMMGGGSVFAWQQYDNLSNSAAAIATINLLSTSPINWINPPFGAAPTGP